VIVIDNNAIHIVDSVMGTGKTQACIAWMRQHPEQKYLYVTPYLDECSRIQASAPELDFQQPQENKTKSADLLRLLSEEKNITTTHELLSLMKDSDVEYIKKFKYILFLDEELSCIENLSIESADLDFLMKNNFVQVEQNTKEVRWTNPDNKKSKLIGHYKEDIQRKPHYLVKDNVLMWLFQLDVLKAFESVYILTFLFSSSIMAGYLINNDVSFDFCHVENGSFADGYKRVTQEEKASFKELIEIYEGSYNDNWYGKTRKKDDRFLLSQNWFSKQSNSVRINQLRNNAYNFVRYKCKAHKEDVLWTSYKDYADALTSDKLTYQSRKSNWLAWNTKATNQYADRTVLVYLLNVFPNPLFKNYLENDNFQFNEDDYALSALLQWIWRSAIRNGKKVTIYIPAPRMRQLLTDWLNG
jgi:hypothetical protein